MAVRLGSVRHIRCRERLQVVVNTTGLPAMAGFASTLIGILLLILATILAIVGQVRWPGEKTSLSRVRELR